MVCIWPIDTPHIVEQVCELCALLTRVVFQFCYSGQWPFQLWLLAAPQTGWTASSPRGDWRRNVTCFCSREGCVCVTLEGLAFVCLDCGWEELMHHNSICNIQA
jgi:hypothetical protein